MKRLTALMLCLVMALCILPAQALTLAGPFTFDLETFQAYYPQLIQKDVAWLEKDGMIAGTSADLPDLQLYMSEAGDVEYMVVEMSCPISEADKAVGEAFGTVISGAALGVLLCEVTDQEAVNAGVQTFMTELEDVIACITNFDSMTDEEKLAGVTSYGPLANHEGCVGVKVSEDGTVTFMFVFAPDGIQFE
ncbi:MAG: hypothetical protein ACI4ML_06845 [Aristaeellaceae bacterium]